MFQVPDPYIAFNNYQILRMFKAIYDYKKDFIKELKGVHIDSDFMYETFWICLSSVISKVRNYYSDCWEGELIFLRDKRIDEYFQLVLEHSRLTGLKENDNPYYKDAIKAVDISLSYQDNMYDCGFQYNKKTYRACRIILGLYGEFSYYYEIIEGMIGLMEFFEENTEKLRQEVENMKRLEAAA